MKIEKIKGEVIDKSYGEIMEEIRRKLEKFNTRNYPLFSKFQDSDLIVLMPKRDYDILVQNVMSDIFAKDIRCNTIFGVKFEVAEVNKIYVAYDEHNDMY